MIDITDLTIKEANTLLKSKQIKAVELAKLFLQRIEKLSELNAFITTTEDEALDTAKKVDDLIADNQPISNLAGIPIGLKDLFATKGTKTTAASKVLEDYVPPYDSTVTAKLRAENSVFVGKTNLDAFAHGSSGENSDFGPTLNPYDLTRVPGGSSSGSAVSVAAGLALAATGTDTGGSIRLPATFCNVVGLKPTYGRVSRYGIIAMASSLDSIGHFTKTVWDNAAFLNATAGIDPLDATTSPNKPDDYISEIEKGVEGVKIGLPKEYFKDLGKDVKELVMAAVKRLESLGAKVEEISLPHTKYGIAAYYIIQPSEVSSNLARYDGIRYGNSRNNFGAENKRRIMLGTFTLSSGYYDAYYLKAMKVRRLIREDFVNAFKKVDAIIAPTSPTPPFKIGEKTSDPLEMYLSDIFTPTINIAGVPSLNVPCGFLENLPMGMQIIGPDFSEKLLFQIGQAYEQETKWYKQKPNFNG